MIRQQDRRDIGRVVILIVFLVGTGCRTDALPAFDRDTMPFVKGASDLGGVVLHEEENVEFVRAEDGSLESRTTRYRRTHIINDRGRYAAEMVFGYSRAFETVLEFQARVTLPDGTVRNYGKDDAVDVVYLPGYELYTDTRVFGVVDDAVPPGSVVEIRSVVSMSRAEIFSPSWCFGGYFHTVESTFTVTAPDDIEIRHVSYKMNAPITLKPDVENEMGTTTYAWTEKDLKPITRYDDAPNGNHRKECVYAWPRGSSPTKELGFDDDKGLSRFIYQLNESRSVVDDNVRRIVAQVLKDAPKNPKERAARLYHWVQTQITYCAIEVGIGGWQPHSSVDTMRVGAGDCKDKATVLRALLKADGIESLPVSIHSHDGFPNRFRVPAIGANFNHAILSVEFDDGPVLVDPTTRLVPFGELPFNDQGADFLKSSVEGHPIATSEFSTPNANRQTQVIRGALSPDGTLLTTTRLTSTGEFASRLKEFHLYLLGAKRMEAFADALRLPDDAITDLAFIDVEHVPMPRPVTATFATKFENVVSGTGATRLMSMRSILKNPLPDLRRPRNLPVILGVPSIRSTRIEIPLPLTLVVEHVPAPVSIETDLIGYRLTHHVIDGVIVLERDVTVKRAVVDAVDEKALIGTLAKIRRAEDIRWVFAAKGGKQ